MKWIDVSAEGNGYDWVCNYQPAVEGDPVNAGSSDNLTDLDYFFKESFYLKKADMTVWFNWESTSNFWASYSLEVMNDNSRSFVIPQTLPDGTSRDGLIRQHDNKIQIKTDVVEDKIEIWINNEYHGSMKLSDTRLDVTEKAQFGFHRFATTQNNYEVTKMVIYKANIDTTTSLKQINEGNHFETNEFVEYEATLLSEYNVPLSNEKIRLFCNNDNVSFDTDYGGVIVETGTRYYNLTTDNNGKGVFRLMNVTDTATKYDVQIHKEKDYSYNYSISSPIRAWYRTQPIIDTNSVVDSTTYSNNKKLYLNAVLKDNKGNEIQDVDFGKIYINGVNNQIWDNTKNNYISLSLPNGVKDEYIISVKWEYDESDLYHSVETTKEILIVLPKDDVEFEILDDGSTFYPNQSNIKLSLFKLTNYKSDTTKNKTVKIYKNDSLFATKTTNNEGIISFSDSLDAGTQEYVVKFGGNSSLNSTQITVPVLIEKGEVSFTCIENTESVYLGQSNIFKLKLLDAKGNPITNYSISSTIVFDNGTEKTYTAKTNSNGIATFTIQSPNTTNPISAYSSDTWFNTDNNHFSKELESVFFEWVNKKAPKLNIQTLDVRYPHEAKVTGILLDNSNNNPIKNATIKFYVDDVYIESADTDNDGKVVFTNTQAPKSYPTKSTYKLEFEGDNNYGGVISTKDGGYYRNKTKIIEVLNTEEVYVGEENRVVLQLLSNENTPLKNSTLKYNMTITNDNGTVETSNDKIKTDSTGNVSFTVSNNKKGTAVIEWNYVGSTNYDVSTITVSFSWKKSPTHIIIASNSGNKEVTKQGKITIQLLDKNDNPIVGASMYKTLEFKTINGDEVTLESYVPKTTLTGNYGESTIQYTATKQGDIVGKFTWTFAGDDNYEGVSFNTTLTWSKIETIISSKNVTHYNGRYTNIFEEEPPWNAESPGVDTTYKNLWAKIETTNTETNYEVVSGGIVEFVDTANGVRASATTNENGVAEARFTRTLKTLPNTSNYTARFNGNDLFKPSSVKFQLKTLPRVNVIMDKYVYISHPEGIRYNVPFTFGVLLKEEESDSILPSMPVKLKLGDVKSWNAITHSNGRSYVSSYVPKVVGNFEVIAEFNQENIIDKYNPYSYSYNITINKDYTILTITTDKTKYTDCNPATVTYKLTDSLERGISDKIYINYDDGTYKNSKWLPLSPEYLTSNTNGVATYSLAAYSGIRLLQAIFNETWCYEGSNRVSHVEYDLSKVYTATVNNGLVEFAVECALNMTKGLPNGLYDVKIEYIPPNAESGKCILYSTSEKTEPIRKKTGVKLEVNSTEFEKPVYEPLFVSAKATDFNNAKLIGYDVTSYINDSYRSYPNHVTDSNGTVSRGYASIIIGSVNKYSFVFNQTREYAGCLLDINTTTLKRRPILEVPSSISGYTSIPVEMTATHYFTHNTYNRYGKITKQDSEGNYVFHNPLAANNDDYYEYYYVKNDAEIECNKSYYDGAENVSSKLWISNKNIIWKNNNKSKTLSTALTNSNGVATATYTSPTAMNENVHVISEEDDYYLSSEAESHLTIILRNETWFGDINFDEKDTNGNYIRYATYRHEFPLFAYLYMDSSKRVKEGEEVIFKQGNAVLGKSTTDSNGRAVLTIRANKPTLYPYTVEYVGHDQYTSATKSYNVHVAKQTPLISLTISNTNPTIGDKITLKATFTESNAAGANPLKSTGLLFKDGNENILWQRTDENGIATIQYTVKHAGQRTFYVGYEDENNERYNTVSKTQTITVKKIATSILCTEGNPFEIPGDSSYKLTFSLKDINKKTLLDKKINVSFNNTTKEYTTNNYGEIKVDTGEFPQGTSKNMVLTFNGDDNYETTTFTENLTWGQSLNREDCSNLDNFDIIYENWYASDGSSKWGLDVNGLNLLDGQTANNNDKYKNQCTPILNTDYKLRVVCNKLVTNRNQLEDLFNEENKIVAPTGVAVRSKRIKTTSNCTINFYFTIKYDKSNEAYNGNSSNYLMAGHFGLLEGGNLTTAEKAAVRLEFYRGNAYMISEGRNATYSNLRYKLFTPSQEYLVQLDILNNKITVTFYNGKNEKVSDPQTWTLSKSLENLHPYAFAYTNGTALVLREIEIVKR